MQGFAKPGNNSEFVPHIGNSPGDLSLVLTQNHDFWCENSN